MSTVLKIREVYFLYPARDGAVVDRSGNQFVAKWGREIENSGFPVSFRTADFSLHILSYANLR